MRTMFALILACGCNRALPVAEPPPPVVVPQTDAGSLDAGLQSDMLCWDADSSAQCYPLHLPCIYGTPSDCGYPYGEYGCPPDQCRGHLPPDMWGTRCNEWDDAGLC